MLTLVPTDKPADDKLYRDYGSPEANEKVRAARDALPPEMVTTCPTSWDARSTAKATPPPRCSRLPMPRKTRRTMVASAHTAGH